MDRMVYVTTETCAVCGTEIVVWNMNVNGKRINVGFHSGIGYTNRNIMLRECYLKRKAEKERETKK